MREVTLSINLGTPEPRNVTSIFHLAQGFYLAGNRCLLNIEVGPDVTQCLVSPGVVNLCLACELFLKAAITHEGGKPAKTHKLQELVAIAPKAYVEQLRSEYNRIIPQPDFDSLIAQANEYFVQVRYGHEFPVTAFHEFPLAMLGRCMYVATAKLVGERTGLQLLQP
jgi:hypothetical protein